MEPSGTLVFSCRYPIYGGMQDWNYIHGGCFELTLEISDDKWPHASEVKASRTFADYHRLLTPGEKYEVIATMPGYKSKTTHVILEEASTVDFILDPLITLDDGILSEGCDCSFRKNGFKLIEIFPGQNLEIFLVLIFILVFLCFLMKRKAVLNRLKQKQIIGPRRPLVV